MKEAIKAQNAPQEIGAYSNAIKAGNLIFVSGQLPADPATGVIPPTIEEQTRQVIANVEAILADAGATLANVVKTTVILSEMSLFSQMNAIYAQTFPQPYPARSSMSVKELPRNSLIALDVVAII